MDPLHTPGNHAGLARLGRGHAHHAFGDARSAGQRVREAGARERGRAHKSCIQARTKERTDRASDGSSNPVGQLHHRDRNRGDGLRMAGRWPAGLGSGLQPGLSDCAGRCTVVCLFLYYSKPPGRYYIRILEPEDQVFVRDGKLSTCIDYG